MSFKNVFLLSVCFVAHSHAMAPAEAAPFPADGHITDIEQIKKFFSADGTTLILRNKNITSIDANVFDQIASAYPNIQVINLANNKLTHLPESISKLAQLRCLSLNDNILMHVPISLSLIASLEELYLQNTLVGARPEWSVQKDILQHMPRLRHLGESLPQPPAVLPETITNITQIVSQVFGRGIIWPRFYNNHTLTLANTPIENIAPDVFAQIADLWPDLEVIDLTNTPLAREILRQEALSPESVLPVILPQNRSIRDGLSYLKTHTKLKKVILSDTQAIDERSSWFLAHITSLDELTSCLEPLSRTGPSERTTFFDHELFDANSLNLEQIDDAVFEELAQKYPEIWFVSLSCNPYLRKLPTSIASLKKLEALHICATSIACIPDEIALMPSLKTIVALDAPLLARQPELAVRINKLRAIVGLAPIDIQLSAEDAVLPEMAEATAHVTRTAEALAAEISHAHVLIQHILERIHRDGATPTEMAQLAQLHALTAHLPRPHRSDGESKSSE